MKKWKSCLPEKYLVTNNVIYTFTNKKKEWKRIWINGKKSEYEINKDGTVRDVLTEREIKPYITEIGYVCYNLKIDNKPIRIFRHRLLAGCFLTVPKKYRSLGYEQENLVVNHKDGIKGHDELDNLEWCTQKENSIHAVGIDLTLKGENSHMSTITNDQAREICELLSQGLKIKEVSEQTGVREKVIRHIYNRESWKQISKDYIFHDYGNSKPYQYSDADINNVCKLLEKRELNTRQIAEITGVSQGYINDIKNGKRRTDISKDYDLSESNIRNAPKARIAREACELLEKGDMKVKQIAQVTGMNPNMISGIKNGRYWTSISKDYTFVQKAKENPVRVSDEKVHEICKLIQEGKLTNTEIAKEIGVTRQYVRNIKEEKQRSEISSQYDFSNHDQIDKAS